jgi:hypothetical protein
MKMFLRAVLPVIAGLATTVCAAPVESPGKDSDVTSSPVNQKPLATTTLSKFGAAQSKVMPRVSILDTPITLKIEIMPLIHSERSRESSFDWRK